MRLVRPGKSELRRNFVTAEGIFSREKALPAYRKQLRELAELEHRKVGLPLIERAMDRNSDEKDAIEDAVAALSPSLATVSAMAIMEMAREVHREHSVAETLDEIVLARPILTTARPHLTGVLARDVADLLADEERPAVDRLLWRPGRVSPQRRREAEAPSSMTLLNLLQLRFGMWRARTAMERMW
jgi:hypothetical protein